MNDNDSQEKQKDTPKDHPEYFWGFQGVDYVKPPEGLIYEPMANRTNNQSDQKDDVAIKIRRDGFDFAGWVISLVTLLVVGVYTYYAGGQWQEMIKATHAAKDAASISALALQSSQDEFLSTLQQMQAQTGAQVQSAQATIKTADIAAATQRPWMKIGLQLGNGLIPHVQGDELNIIFNVSNIGTGVAHDVEFHLKAEVPPFPTHPEKDATAPHPNLFEMAGNLGTWCKTIKPDNLHRDIFFPNDTRPRPPWSITLTTADMRKSEVQDDGNYRFIALVFGCALYKYGSFPEWHHSGVVYELTSSRGGTLEEGVHYEITDLSLAPFSFYPQFGD
jgi:hypothetical protein